MKIVGVDPGLRGALALLDVEREALLRVVDIVASEGQILAGAVADALADWMVDRVVIEKVHSMPRQGVRSMFTFGRALGTVEGICAALELPVDYLAPRVWKSKLGLGKDKSASRALASRIWAPQRELFARVKDDGRAEAALIGLAYCRSLRSSPSNA